MKSFIYTFAILVLAFFGSTHSFGQCQPENISFNSCDNSSSIVNFDHLETIPLLFQVGTGSRYPLLQAGQYQWTFAPPMVINNWEQGQSMFFVFDGEHLSSSSNLSLLEKEYKSPGNNQIVIYGLDQNSFKNCTTTLTLSSSQEAAYGSIVASTYAYPVEQSDAQFTNFNDVIQIPQGQIFQVYWGSQGSTECQDFSYSLTITY